MHSPPPLLLHRPNNSHHFHLFSTSTCSQQPPHPSTHTRPEAPKRGTSPACPSHNNTHLTQTHTAESRPNPTAKLPTSALQRTAKKNPASGARACNLLGAGANHLGAPHTHAQRASRPTDPGERAKRRRRARLMPSNVSGLPSCQARDQHPSHPIPSAWHAVLYVLYCAAGVCCGCGKANYKCQ